MYRGFNINLTYDSPVNYSIGLHAINKQKSIVRDELLSFLSPEGEIDGSRLESSWFPQVEADIFISHSHKDEKLAITLAGWLFSCFGLKSFIDSTIWGYSNNLLKKLDDLYCPNDGMATYNYQKRNNSTSHVHLMLSAALAKMMDNTECLFFLNTPNSVKPSGVINQNNTNSPWLYYELGISSLIRKPLQNHLGRKGILKGKLFSELNESARAELLIKYPLKIEHLKNITGDDLTVWNKKFTKTIPIPDYPLDILYESFL